MWIVIITTLASLVGLVILSLCVPIDVTARFDTQRKPRFTVKITCLFGLVTKEVRREETASPHPIKQEMAEGEPHPKRKRENVKTLLVILRTKGLPKQVIKLVKDVLSRLRINEFGVNLRVGLDNPADTGLLFAVIGPAVLFWQSSHAHEIRVEPSFHEAVFAGYLYGTIRVRPIQLVPPVLKFIFSPAAIRAAKKLVSANVKERYRN